MSTETAPESVIPPGARADVSIAEAVEPPSRTSAGGQRLGSRVAGVVLLLVAAAFFLFPFYALARASFQRVPTVVLGASNLFDKWTWDALFQAFRDPAFGDSLVLSTQIAAGAIVITIGLMLPTAVWVHLRIPKARGLVETLTVLPYVVPPIALVVGVFGAFKETTPWFFNSRFALVPFYAVLAMPFTYRSLDAGLRAIDLRTLVDASRSLGAGWGTTLLRVLMPNLRVALLTSSFLTVTVVMGEYTMASLMGFSAPGKTTLPVFTALIGQSGFNGLALGFATLVLTTVLLAAVTFATGRRGAAAAARGI
jgi:putative spermidine/putrescine transport system permease protein